MSEKVAGKEEEEEPEELEWEEEGEAPMPKATPRSIPGVPGVGKSASLHQHSHSGLSGHCRAEAVQLSPTPGFPLTNEVQK